MKDKLILTTHRLFGSQRKYARKIGQRNESKGVREALEFHKLHARKVEVKSEGGPTEVVLKRA